MANIRTHYDNLKVARNAPVSVIKAAYKALCQNYHPDKYQGSNKEAERIMKIVNSSYVVLIDPVKRGIHDVWIREQEAKVKQQGEKAHFGKTGEATEQQHYQRQDKHDIPKTEEPPLSTNPNPNSHAESSNIKFYIKPHQNDINIFAILIDIIMVLILLNYVFYAVAEFKNHDYGLDDFIWSIVLFSMAVWWVLAGRSKIHLDKRPIHDAWIDQREAKANQQAHFTEPEAASNQWQNKKQDTQREHTPPPSPESKHSKGGTPIYSWRRYFARSFIDYGISGLLIAFAIIFWQAIGLKVPNWITDTLLNPEASPLMDSVTWVFFSALLWVIVEPIILSIFGPGKALFRLRLVSDNNVPNYWGSSVALWAVGVGFGIPFVSTLAMLNADARLKKNGQTDWDRWTGFSIEAEPLTIIRKVGLTVSLTVLYVFLTMANKITTTQEHTQQVQAVQSTPSSINKTKKGLYDDVLNPPPRQAIPSSTNNAEDMFHQAVDLNNQGRYADALPLYLYLAEQGYAGAQYNLGVMYANARGVTQDDNQAVYWYNKAAEQGDADAQYNLGVMYANARGVTQDDKQAVYWYRKAAEQGYASAQYNLGIIFDNARGVTQDYYQAVYWYRKAAERGHVSAQSNLANMYVKGQGVAQDYYQAVYWYRKAAEQGYANAQSDLGFMYLTGQGVAKSYNQGAYWVRKAAEQGDAIAQSTLGLMYEAGRGVAQDYTQALYWYRKAAEQGDADAIAALNKLSR